MKAASLLVGLSLLSLFNAACGSAFSAVHPTFTPDSAPAPSTRTQMGYLEGQVTIGPLQPVERADAPTPTTPPEAYTSRSINILRADGATRVANVKINPDGTYRAELPPGTYVVNLAPAGLDRGNNLPATVTIESGETVRLDIDIDTGIR